MPRPRALADELDRYLRGEVIDATTLIPRLRRWNRREPELVARLGGLLLVALIAQFNYYVLSPNPDFWHHYTIQGVLALWAVSAVIFQAMLRSGWHSDQVRVLWSAADIAFLTLELKLFEEILTGSRRLCRGACRDDAARGLSPLDRGLGTVVARQTCLDHDRPGDGRLHRPLCRRGPPMAAWTSRLESEPRPATPQYLPGGPLLDGLCGGAAGQTHPAFEPVL